MENNVSDYAKDLMRHALGLNYKAKPFRNYFLAEINSEDGKTWRELEKAGYARSQKCSFNRHGEVYFFVTEAGAKLLNTELPHAQ